MNTHCLLQLKLTPQYESIELNPQYTTDITHISDEDNTVENALSRGDEDQLERNAGEDDPLILSAILYDGETE